MAIEDEHYRFITTQISSRDMAAVGYVKMYIQLFTTLVAGSVWLRTHMDQPNKILLSRFTNLSDAIAVVSAILTLAFVYDGLRSWRGYRIAQATLARDYRKFDVPLPKWSAARYMEASVLLTVIVTSAVFVSNNPFRKDSDFLDLRRARVLLSNPNADGRGMTTKSNSARR